MSAEIRKGYRLTEVGVIPTDWEVKRIGELCDYQNGKSLEHLFNSRDGFKVISIGNYSTEGSHIHRDTYIDPCHGKAIAKFALNKNDLAMSLNDKTSTGAILGRALLIESDNEYVFNQRTMRLRPKNNISPAFLHHSINGDYLHGALTLLAKPGTQIYINTDDVIDLLVPVPPVAEQRAIATTLSDMGTLINSLDQLIAKKRDIQQAAMQQLLTGQRRLPGFSGEWEVKQLGEIAPLQRGFDLPNQKLEKGEYPVVYSNGVMNYHSTFMVKGPGVVTGRSGTIGNVHYIEDSFWPHNTSLWVTNFRGNSPKFISYLLASVGLDRFGTGSGVPTLNRNDVHAHKVSFPPSEKEQTAIATILSDMDAELAALEARHDKARQLKRGMMQELLTGRVRFA